MAKTLKENIAAFSARADELREYYDKKFVIFYDGELCGSFDTFDAAAREAVKKYGKGPYLIRQVGGISGMPMPASVAYRPLHAGN